MGADAASIWLLLEQVSRQFYVPWFFWGLPFLLVPVYKLARRLRNRCRRQ